MEAELVVEAAEVEVAVVIILVVEVAEVNKAIVKITILMHILSSLLMERQFIATPVFTLILKLGLYYLNKNNYTRVKLGQAFKPGSLFHLTNLKTLPQEN